MVFKSYRSLLIFFAMFALVAITHLPHWRQPWFWDSLGAYWGVTYAIHASGLNPIQGGDSFIGHPSFLPWLYAAAWKFAGDPIWPPHFVVYLLTAAMLFYLHRLLRLFDIPDEVSLPGVAVFYFLPMVYAQSAQLNFDLPMTAFLVMAVYFFMVERPVALALSGVAMGLCKAYGGFLFLPFLVFAIYRRKWRLAAASLAPIVAYALFVVIVYVMTDTFLGGELWKQRAPSTNSIATYFSSCLYSLDFLFRGSGLEFFAVFLIPVAFKPSWRRQLFTTKFGLIASIALFAFLLLSPIFNPPPRYLLLCYPFIFVLGLWAMNRALCNHRTTLWLILICISGVSAIRWTPAQAEQIWGRPSHQAGAMQRFFEFDRVREDGRPRSYSGEVSLVYTEYLAAMRQAAVWLERHQGGRKIYSAFPNSGYLTVFEQGLVERPLRIYVDPPLHVGDLVVESSLGRIDMHSFKQEFDFETMASYQVGTQWVRIDRVAARRESQPNQE